MRQATRVRLGRWAVVLAGVLTACGGEPAGSQVVEILRELPHDTSASTQGLLIHEGLLYESTGQYGESTLREVELETGEVVRSLDLADEYFGEGLARVGSELIQLTWHEGVAFVYDLGTFELLRTHEYEGEGWGLCHDGESLFMSNGSAVLHRRDPVSFEILESHEVTRDGAPVRNLNELECVGDAVYANIFQTDRLVRIDKRSGRVTAEFDASVLVPSAGRPPGVRAVLNGIAYRPGSGTFLLTGKLWPAVFEVRLPD